MLKMLIPFAFYSGGAVFALQLQAAHGESVLPPGNSGSVVVLIVTTVVGFMTMIVQQFFAASQQRRSHEYDVLDRKEKADALRAEAKEQAAALLEQTKAQAELLARRNEAENIALKLLIERRAEIFRTETATHVEDLKDIMKQDKAKNDEILRIATDTNKQVSDMSTGNGKDVG